MHRTSRILALTTLLFAAGAALFFTKAAALPYKVAYPVLLLAVAGFLPPAENVASGRDCTPLVCPGRCGGCEGTVHSADAVFRAGPRCLYPLFPLRRGTSCPSCRMAASRGVARVALRRGRAPGLGSGRTDRRRRLRCGHRRDALQRAPVSRGVCRMVPLRGPAVRFFRRRDSLEPFHRGRSRRTYVVMVPYYLAQCLFFCFAVKSLPALPSEGRSV